MKWLQLPQGAGRVSVMGQIGPQRKDITLKMIVAAIITAVCFGFALGVAATFVSVKKDENDLSTAHWYDRGWRDAMANVKDYVENDELLNDYFDFDYQTED